MEKVYNPKEFNCTKPLDLSSYFQNYQLHTREEKNTSSDELEASLNIVKSQYGLTEFCLKDIQNLERLVSPNKLRCKLENKDLPYKATFKNEKPSHVHPFIPEARNLETVKFKEAFNVLHNDNDYCDQFGIHYEDFKDKCVDLEPGSDYIIKIVVYVPSNHLINKKHLKLLCEIEVLGSSTLLDFIKTIDCMSDKFSSEEVFSLDVDLTSMANPKDEYPSRTLFIENTFYNDMSHPNAIDYSELPRKWAEEKDIGELKSENIENVTFNQLRPRLGYSYVYIHQGYCEHIVCFEDARLLGHKDSLDSSNYPRKTAAKRRGSFLCFICSVAPANWLVVNSDKLPMRRVFFCTKCCRSCMFLDGKKLGNFQLFPYLNEDDMKTGLTSLLESQNSGHDNESSDDSDDDDINVEAEKNTMGNCLI